MIGRDERGAAALFITSALVLLIGAAAIAIDVGAGFNERRQNQSAADVGVLAGVIDLLDLGLCGAPGGDTRDGGCNEVLQFVRTNITATFSEDEWIGIWRSCTDPDKPNGFGPIGVDVSNGWTGFSGTRWNGSAMTNAVDCISVSPQELRVRVPDQLTDTTFGAVLGVSELTTNAFAQAALVQPGVGGVLPFGLLANASGHTCLLTAPAGRRQAPCDGSASGNFFTLHSQTWGPPSSDLTTVDCRNPGKPELTINVAIGLDHLIAPARPFVPVDANAYPPSGPPDAQTRDDTCDEEDGEAVPADTNPDTGPRDTMWASTGADDSAEVLAGLITGQAADFAANTQSAGVGVVPRLLNNAGCELRNGTSCETREFEERRQGTPYEYDVNNVPVWNYLEPRSLDSDHFECVIDGTTITLSNTNNIGTTEEMECFLQRYDTSVLAEVEVFSDRIATNPRFAWVPQFHYNVWGPGRHRQPVLGYQMVYLHTLWFEDNGPVEFAFIPGESSSSSVCLGNASNCASLDLIQMEAFVLPANAVPSSIANSFPGGSDSDLEPILTR